MSERQLITFEIASNGCLYLNEMSSIDHLHTEAEMLKVMEHSELLSPQYLARCQEPGNVCHPITTRATSKRQMKETLYTRHRNTVDPVMVARDRKIHSNHSTQTQSIRLLIVMKGMGARWSSSAYKQFRKRPNQEGTFNTRSTRIQIL